MPDTNDNTETTGHEPTHICIEDMDQQTLDALVADKDRLERERDTYLRAAADAENRARTARKDVQESYRQGVTSVARDVVTALDHFDMALAQDMGSGDQDAIVQGMRSIRDELIRALARHGVGVIEPHPGDELNPLQHQVMMDQANDSVPPGHIASMLQVGYTLGDRVIRPAKVIVARTNEANQQRTTDEQNTADDTLQE